MSPAAQMNTGGLPRGELLGRYRTYDQAQKVVDHLAAAEGFDVKALSIVGNDLRSVEHIRSRLSYPKVAGAGAAQGAMFGFFIGLLIWLFAPDSPMINMLLSVVLGMCIWMLIGVVGYAVRRGQRDFASSSQLVATTFDVVCDFSQAPRARQLVASSGVASLQRADDPTGPGVGQGVGQSAGPGAGAVGGPSGASGTGPQSQPRPSGRPASGWQDESGRPRYGVRLTDVKPDEKTDQGEDEPHQSSSPPQ